jgi:hypothetical protein
LLNVTWSHSNSMQLQNQILKVTRKNFQTLIEVIIAMALAVMVLSALTFFYQQVDSLNTQMDKIQREIFQMRYLENRLIDIFSQVCSKDKQKNFYFFSSPDNALFKPGTSSLTFCFDNGISLDKPFSGEVLGRFFLNSANQLILAMWPTPNSWDQHIAPSMKKEILLENVEDLSFEFFIAPEKKRVDDEKKPSNKNDPNSSTTDPNIPKKNVNKDKTPQAADPNTPKKEEKIVEIPSEELEVEPEPKGQWVPSWQNSYQQLPVMIRVKVTRTFEKDKPLYFAFPLYNSPKTIVYDK